MSFTADDLFFLVKKMAASDIKELGSTDALQNTYLFKYATRALKELAHVAYRTRISDALNIASDGDQTFLQGTQPITNLYAPLRILNASGTSVQKRTAYEAPQGWWKESSGNTVNTKGMMGSHTLHYVYYPADVTATADVVDFPDAGMMGLAFWVCGIIKESANGYEEADIMYKRGRDRLKVAVQSNIDGRGVSSGGWVPSIATIDTVFKG